VRAICAALDRASPSTRPNGGHAALIDHVADRPGHDRRYAVDASRAARELGWTAAVDFDAGLEETVRWYIEHERWWRRILDGSYRLGRIGA
jgi:dTDP-glucose 4,6-dehydratase